MAEVDPYYLNPVQDRTMRGASTIPSAEVVTPYGRFSRITGNTSIKNINPPFQGYHELIFVFEESFTFFIQGGNIDIPNDYGGPNLAAVPLYFDNRNQKYYVGVTVTP